MPKVIIISGGSSGLGKEIAKRLSPDNQVIILAHNQEKLTATASEIGCDFALADVTLYPDVEAAVSKINEKYSRIDCLINCVGIWTEGPITENTPEEITSLLDVNTKGTIFLSKAVIPYLEKQNGGEIINIISQDGLTAKKNRSLYHATKWAITGFTKCLQEDYSDKNIKITGVYPGLMKTGLFEKKGVERDLTQALEPSEVAQLIAFVINLSQDTHIPEIGIKHLLNSDKNMDNTGTGMDLNLDPNLITTQGGPQAVSPQTPPAPTIPTPPVQPSDVIDITPSASPLIPQEAPPVEIPPIPEPFTPQPEPTPLGITIPESPAPVMSPLSAPQPEPLPPLPEPSYSIPPSAIDPLVSTPTTPPVIPASPVVEPIPDLQSQTSTDFVVDQSSPLYEDPDAVKLT